MIDLAKLPLSITSFSEFCDRGKIYVDKTDLVADLAKFDGSFIEKDPAICNKGSVDIFLGSFNFQTVNS